jgi:hypothetical protein
VGNFVPKAPSGVSSGTLGYRVLLIIPLTRMIFADKAFCATQRQKSPYFQVFAAQSCRCNRSEQRSGVSLGNGNAPHAAATGVSWQSK